jgi:hypothetical protein
MICLSFISQCLTNLYFNVMDRSKCVMCGKVRYRKYLLQALDLTGRNVWVCSRPVSFSVGYIILDNIGFLHSPCHLGFLKMQYDSLNRQIANYQFSKMLFPLFKEIQQRKNVAPELTFLLQL